MNKYSRAVTVLVLGFGFASAVLADDVCITERPNLIGKTFVAKEMLYDTEVATEGIVKLEWDKEAVPKGGKFRVEEIECKRNKIELTLRPISDRKISKVEIYFLINQILGQ